MNIPLSKPDITQKEIDSVTEVLKSGILSIGPKVSEFEKKIEEYIGVGNAIAVNSGTSGLHLLVKAHRIKAGDEVITTPFSFVASANCILFEGAKPVFADICPDTFNINTALIEDKITENTKAILVVDVFGNPVDIQGLRKIAEKYRLLLLEDSCEALGSEYNGIKCGSGSDGAVFAFYPNKQITTGEGGMIVTDNDEIAGLCRSYRSQGRAVTGLWLEHERLGYNYRLSELNAALGSAQMDRLDEIIEKRSRAAQIYNERLSAEREITVQHIPPEVTGISRFVYVIRLDSSIDRNKVMRHLINNGVACKPYFTPLHLQPYFKKMFGYREGDFPVTEKVAASTVALPFFNDITDEQIDYVVSVLKEGIAAGR